jgi:hypothetical protein
MKIPADFSKAGFQPIFPAHFPYAFLGRFFSCLSAGVSGDLSVVKELFSAEPEKNHLCVRMYDC